jgi:hypothetical protein
MLAALLILGRASDRAAPPCSAVGASNAAMGVVEDSTRLLDDLVFHAAAAIVLLLPLLVHPLAAGQTRLTGHGHVIAEMT